MSITDDHVDFRICEETAPMKRVLSRIELYEFRVTGMEWNLGLEGDDGTGDW